MEKICKNCKNCILLANSTETGQAVCSHPMSYFPVDITDECHYSPKPYTCGDCDRLGSDDACFTCQAEDSAYYNGELCGGFIDRQYVNVLNALFDWTRRGININEKLTDAMQEFADEYEEPFVPKGAEDATRTK